MSFSSWRYLRDEAETDVAERRGAIVRALRRYGGCVCIWAESGFVSFSAFSFPDVEFDEDADEDAGVVPGWGYTGPTVTFANPACTDLNGPVEYTPCEVIAARYFGLVEGFEKSAAVTSSTVPIPF